MLLLPVVALALLAQFEPLQPHTYTSPSGAWSLHVEPHDRDGFGEADYAFAHGEREVWRASEPFTLWNALVDDEGRVAGCGYTRSSGAGEATRLVVVWSPAGELLLHDESDRRWSDFEGLFEAAVCTGARVCRQGSRWWIPAPYPRRLRHSCT